MTDSLYQRATEAADFLRSKIKIQPQLAIILGSGLGAVAEQVTDAITVPYSAIPHFPQSTVPGHSGQLVAGLLNGSPVAVMQGRVHGYEGYKPEEVTFPVRVLGRLGIETLVVTNAAGGIRTDLHQGDLVLLSDHINFSIPNPCIGPNDPKFGPRFFDMTEAYSRCLRGLAQSAAKAEGFALPEGVYLAVTGPSFETPAEIRAFRTLGADMVGMSTVPEVIVARQMGLEVLGISCVTNMAAGISTEPLNHEEVMETGRRVQQRLAALLVRLAPQLRKESTQA
jgi:purine-nucleoside phosphorylase